MGIFTRPILEINLKKVAENYLFLQKMAKSSVAAAVVKDDAYGLGAIEVSKTLYEAGCRKFFVAHAVEGERIRAVVKDADIFVLQGIGEDSLDSFKKANLTPVISVPAQLEFWCKNKIKSIKPIIQIETGLNRLGFRESDLEKYFGLTPPNIPLKGGEQITFSYVVSHLACGDEDMNAMNERQLNKFLELKNKYFPNVPASLSASDGVFLGKAFQMDMVRLGAAMYGLNTTPYRDNRMKNVITLKAPILQVVNLKKGEFVGYGATFRATKNMRVAVVSIGYGDGLFRSLSNKGNFVGRISMDNIVYDISSQEDFKVGDFIELINDDYTADDMAKDAGTIGYEIISRIGKGMRDVKKILGK